MLTRKMTCKVLFCTILFVVMVTSTTSVGVELHVPDDYLTIEAAVEAASDDDIIVIHQGIYIGYWTEEHYYNSHKAKWETVYYWHAAIDPNGKELTFRSVNPDDEYIVATTIIYGGGLLWNEGGDDIFGEYLPCAYVHNEEADCKLIGLTIKCGFIGTEIPDCVYGGYPKQPYCDRLDCDTVPAIDCGAVVCDGANITISQCVFEGGDGDEDSHDIRGIYCENSNSIIEDCTITIANLSHRVWNRGLIEQGYGSTSAVYIKSREGNSNATIDNCTISENGDRAIMLTCGENSSEEVLITGCTINNNDLSGNSTAEKGAGIHIDDYHHHNLNVRIEECELAGNKIGNGSGDVGGAICIDSCGNVSIYDCEIRDNEAYTTGGIFLHESTDAEIDECDFEGNVSTHNYGGAIWLWGCASADIKNCTIGPDNEAPKGGGIGILHETDIFPINECTISKCTIIDNKASVGGGGILCNTPGTIITHCLITGNQSNNSEYGGGGIFFKNISDFEVINCLITGNNANDGKGGGILCIDDNHNDILSIINSTIADNSTSLEDGGGGAWFSSGADVDLTNCIFWGNFWNGNPANPHQQIDVQNSNCDDINIKNCDIQYSDVVGDYLIDVESGDDIGINGGGNIIPPTDQDPQFADSDYHISSYSPCKDAGDNSAALSWLYDIDGDNRIINSQVDIGADEFAGAASGLVYNIDKESWHDTIGDAIVNATTGDRLVAYPHHYKESVNFGGKELTLQSVDPEDPCVVVTTIIDADGDLYAVEMMNGSVLNGFTVTGALDNCIYLDCSCGTIKNCVIEDNGGSGIYQRECGSPIPGPCLVVEDCIIRNNEEEGIYADYSSARIERCEIYGHDRRGIIISHSETTTISDNIIYSNGYEGISVGYSSTATISNNIIYGNSRGIYAEGDDLDVTIEENEIYSNTSEGIMKGDSSNGAIIIQRNRIHSNNYGIHAFFSYGTVNINNNLIYGNLNSGIKSHYCQSIISNNTVVNNTYYGIDAQEHLEGPPTNIYNCIVWGNNDDIELNGTIGLTYNCIKDGDDCESNGNICSDPQFIDADFHIDAGSPCVNAGDPDGDYEEQRDIDYQPRLWDGRADIGADESLSGRLVHNTNQKSWHETIQEAIGDANNGDELVVFPAVYYENIDFIGKTITVRSTDPYDWDTVGSTIIDGGHYYTVKFISEESSSVLKGLTIRNGHYSGIWCYCCSPTISNCIIEGNTRCGIDSSSAPHPLPGLTVKNSIIRNNEYGIMADAACTFEGNQIYSNTTGIFSAGIEGTIKENHIYGNDEGIYVCDNTTAPIEGNWIYDNDKGIHACDTPTAPIEGNWIYGNSSGIYTEEHATVTIRNNMIYSNWVGVRAESGSTATVTNNTIVKNGGCGVAVLGGAAEVYNCILWDNIYADLVGCSATYSCIERCDEAIGEHNICGEANNPLLFDEEGDDFLHLRPNSPCIDVGDPNPDRDYDGQVDIDGEPRLIGDRVDIGADETDYPVEPSGEIIWPTIYPDAHWWQLDETSGTIAYDSVGDSNGTFNGDDPCWVDGLIGGAVDFNGVNDYFSVPGLDNGYSPSDTFTVTGWFNTESSAMQTVVGQWSQYGGGAYFGWQVLVENKKVVAKFGYDMTTMEIAASDTNDLNDGAWHQFAMVYDDSDAVLYVDGEPEATGFANFMLNDTKFRIGDGSYVCYYSTANEGGPFNGMIDEMMIFDRVLSAEEVEELFETGSPD